MPGALISLVMRYESVTISPLWLVIHTHENNADGSFNLVFLLWPVYRRVQASEIHISCWHCKN